MLEPRYELEPEPLWNGLLLIICGTIIGILFLDFLSDGLDKNVHATEVLRQIEGAL